MANRVSTSTAGFISSSDFKSGVVPTEPADGSNLIFTVPEDYVPGSLSVYSDGQVRKAGADFDYVLSGDGDKTITFVIAPNYWVLINYIKQ